MCICMCVYCEDIQDFIENKHIIYFNNYFGYMFKYDLKIEDILINNKGTEVHL